LVLPKRIAKQAVTRNLIRRQAREAFRHNASVLPALDVVLRLTRSLNELKLGRAAQKKKYRAEIEALLQKIFAAQDVKSSGASL